MTFSLPSTSCLFELPTDTALRTANWPRLNMTNHMIRHRSSALYGAGTMGAYFLLIFNTHISFQSCNRRSTIDIRHSPQQHFLKYLYTYLLLGFSPVSLARTSQSSTETLSLHSLRYKQNQVLCEHMYICAFLFPWTCMLLLRQCSTVL